MPKNTAKMNIHIFEIPLAEAQRRKGKRGICRPCPKLCTERCPINKNLTTENTE
jgi:hypothetical protein